MKASFDYRTLARESLRENWHSFALVALVFHAISCLSGTFSFIKLFGYYSDLFLSRGITFAFIILVASPLEFAFFILCLRNVRKNENQQSLVSGLFSIFAEKYEQSVIAMFVIALLELLLGAVTLGIGAVILSLAYAMVPFIYEDDPSLDFRDALRISREMMYGHKVDLFMLYLSFIGWFLVGIMTCGIGMLWVYPYMVTAVAHFYEDVKTEFLSRTDQNNNEE